MNGQTRANSDYMAPELLLQAYAAGYFPMADSREGEIGWYSPDPRAIIPLETFHVPRSLRLTINKQPYSISINTDFEGVMRACAEREDTWISEEIIAGYAQLHRLGFAHSLECRNESGIVGGLYGVALRGAFFGESMFSKARDASKIALVYLVERLKEKGFTLLDTQFTTPHLQRFGTIEIPRSEYLRKLKFALKQQCRFQD